MPNKPFSGDSVPDWEPYLSLKSPEGAPNISFVLFEDTGLAAGPQYDGRINKPALQKLADRGLVYSRRHTTAWQVGTCRLLRSRTSARLHLWSAFVLVSGLMAQELAPIGIVRGALSNCDANHLTLHDDDNHTLRFVIDGRTFIERDYQRVSCSKLGIGDRMEIVSDRSSEPGARYARMARVMTFEARQRPRLVILPRAPLHRDSPTLRFAPRGNITFSGIVLRRENAGLLLRTRADGEKWIRLNYDTLFHKDGLQVDLSYLNSGTRVFVRADADLQGEIQAHEVVWGEILSPSGLRQ